MRTKMLPRHQVSLMVGLMMATSTVSSTSVRYGRDNECYKEIRSGLRIESSHVDKYVRAGSLRDCERACDIAFFACQSFAYSGFHLREPENCLLSREDTHTLDINDPRDFYNDRDFAFYEKTSGRDCDYEAEHQHYYHGSDVCYDLVKIRERIASRYVVRVLKTRDRQECEQECTRSRECKGFNYRYKTIGYNQYRDNCELSSRDSADRYDFQSDDDFDFYEQSLDSRNCHSGSAGYNQGGSSGGSYYGSSGGSGGSYYGNDIDNHHHSRDECFRLAKTETVMESRVIRERVEVRDISDCEYECRNTRFFTCRSYAFRYSHGYSQYRENCYLTDREYGEMSTYDLVHDREFDFYERRLYDRECGGGTDLGGGHGPNEVDGGDVTVSGSRCHRDRCREDREAGYYFCETDFAGAWDYCCRPREVCGFSEGYDKKWCYVGIEGRDQWRPCEGQGPGREYLKEEHPRFDLVAESSQNVTEVQVFDLNDLALAEDRKRSELDILFGQLNETQSDDELNFVGAN